jgi:mRNA interferase MazF
VLIVSREVANAALPVVTALPVTSLRQGRRVYPNEALLPAGTAGLDRDSVVMAHHIRAISKRRLGAFVGTIEDQELRVAVRGAVRVQLDLDG